MRGLVAICVGMALWWPCLGTEEITPGEYRLRRDKLRQEVKDTVIILLGGTEGERGNLRTPFFQDSNFYYLTGWKQPGAILVISPSDETFFIPKRSAEREKWTGPKAAPGDPGIQEITGFEKVLASEDFEAEFPELVKAASKIATLLDQPGAQKLKALLPLREMSDAAPAIGKLRRTKSAAELALIRKANRITMDAHRASWARIAPGLHEYQVAAAMSGLYFEAGCERHAYPPIVGSGPNAVTLHYNANSRRFDSGELVLMDVGAECSAYAADITRTVPASGGFSPRQRELYEIVLGAQKAVIAAVKPGMNLARSGPNSLHMIAVDYFNNHGKDRHGEPLGKYFIHGIGHHVGLDVHDPGDPNEPLAPGMVITVEPGLYIPEEGIGIRIEDMVLVTGSGAEVLSAALPKDAGEIEKAVRKEK